MDLRSCPSRAHPALVDSRVQRRCASWVAALVVASGAAAAAEPSRAPQGTSAGAAAAGAPPAPPSSSTPASSAAPPRGQEDERPVPDYDGRPDPTSFGDGALWVPRVVLFPLYVVSEYVVRRPIGWLVSTAEREHWPTFVMDFLTFGEDRQGGIVPTALIDYGLRPSVGIYAFWNDFIVAENDLRFRGAYGGSGLYQLRLTDRFPLGAGRLSMTVSYESRPDNVFYGIGPVEDSLQSEVRSRYYRSVARAGAIYSAPWERSSYARIGAGLREVDLDGDRSCCGEPSVTERVQAGDFVQPAGMGQVFDVADQSLEVVLDSRFPRQPASLERASDYLPPPGNGVRLALRGALTEVAAQSIASGGLLADVWVHYGASLGGFVDLNGHQRSLGLTAIADFVDPLGAGQVPLTDLVTLGGDRPLRGFLAGQFSDRTAAALRFEYRWPVAVWLDGTLTYEAGNVFGKGLSGLELAKLRSSFGLGLQAVGAQDHVFQTLLAFGTEPYDAGARIDSVRFVLGTTAGF